MSATTLTVETGELRSFQDEIAQIGIVGKGQVLESMGRALQTTLVDHLGELDRDEIHHRTANRLGAGITHFYGGAARGVHAPQIEGTDEVSVSISSEGLAQRYHGGVIGATNAKWLTIPAIAEAYGKRAGSFNNLRFVLFRPDLAALVEKMEKRTRTDAKGIVRSADTEAERGRVVYWLKKSVTQEGDPSVLPTDDEMSAAAIAAGQEALTQLEAQS